MNKLILFFILIPLFIYSENALPLSNHEGGSISLVNGCVNVITGNFIDYSCDVTLNGAEPLAFERYYTSSNSLKEGIWGYFNHNFESSLYCFYPEDTNQVSITYTNNEGRKSSYYGPLCLGRAHSTKMHRRGSLATGYTNIGRGMISARNNIKNSYMEDYKRIPGLFFKGENGNSLQFLENGKQFPTMREKGYSLVKEEKANGNIIKYQYDYSRLDLKEVKATNKEQNIIYSNIKFKRQRKKELKKTLEYGLDLSDGRKVVYKIQKFVPTWLDWDETHYRITHVIKPDAPFIAYKWGRNHHNNGLMTEKKFPENRFLQIKYFPLEKNSTFNFHRVKYLLAPRGHDQKPVIINEFHYERLKTTVFDAKRHMQIFHYNPQQRLEKIDKCKGTENQGLYTRENFYWSNEGNLNCHTLQSETGEVHAARLFQYDERGNIISNSFYGNLQGGITHISFDERNQRPRQEGCNSWTVNYKYTQDGRNLLTEEREAPGKSIEYEYDVTRDLPTAKFILDNGQILIREYYEYDHFGLVCCFIKDDGVSKDKNNLSGVTERKITRTANQNEVPFGLPRIVAEYYLDLETKNEIQIKKIVNHYNFYGHLTAQEVYGSDEQLSYIENFEPDAHGNSILAINGMGERTTKTYTENDELKSEKVHGITKKYKHDFSGRVIQEKGIHSDGNVFITTHRYNVLNEKIETIDPSGAKTLYEYDDFSRLIKTEYPPYQDPLGNSFQAITRNEYDIFGNVTKTIDPKGIETFFEYTSRGQKKKITSPLGTEIFEYNDEGTLKKSIENNGVSTFYTHDKLGRLLKKEIFSPAGEFLGSISSTYNSFHKLSDSDLEGNITYYHYHPSGELKSIIKQHSKIEYGYDELKRVASEKVFVSENSFRNNLISYDLLNRIVEERIEDEMGALLSKKQFSYDRFGNRSEIREENQAGLSISKSFFNSKNQVVKTVDPKGNEKNFSYNWKALNPRGERVLEITEVDTFGTQTITTMTVFGKPETIIKKNLSGVLLAKKTIGYDILGNVSFTLEKAIEGESQEKEVLTQWIYNELSQLHYLIEASGTPDQKTTEYRYNSYGLLETTMKPDGEKIEQTYDDFKRIKSYKSSNGSFSYLYEYDLNGNLIKSTDLIRNESTLRKYNALGFMIEEVLQTGVQITYEYDLIGRPLLVKLHDGSSITYEYDPLHLRRVKRFSKKGEEIFSHDYLEYDNSGSLLKEINSFLKEPSSYCYDLNNNLIEIESLHFKETITYDGENRLIGFDIENSFKDIQNQFSYDELHQLKSEKGFSNHDYSFDSLHNCIKKDGLIQKVNFLNQLLETQKKSLSYDLNGNRKKEGSNNYEYDSLDRLIKVTSQKEAYHYSYDSFNRRLSKEIKTLDGKSLSLTYYLYFGQNEVGSFGKDNALKEFRMLGTGKGAEIGATVLIEKENRLYFPQHDHNGNIISLLEGKNLKVVESYRYSSFGEVTIFDTNGKKVEKALNPWQFSSKRIDEETGFANFGRRYYDSQTARWLSPDPIGFEEGPNLYAYVRNSPLNHNDLYGLKIHTANGGRVNAKLGGRYDTRLFNRLKNTIKNNLSQTIAQSGVYLASGTIATEKIYYDDEFEKGYEEQSRNVDLKDIIANYNRSKLPNIAIGFNNGIMNLLGEAAENALHVSDLAGGVDVLLTYNQTHGFFKDVLEAGRNLYGYVATKPVKVLQEAWRNYLENNPVGHILHYSHSQGTIHTRNALMDFPKGLSSRIHLVLIAPAAYVEDHLCGSVTHYRSKRDIVPLFDDAGRQKCRDSTKVLKPHKDAPWFDHDFKSPTYRQPIKEELTKFKEKYGN